MKRFLFAPALLLAALATPAHAQFAVDLYVGPNFTTLSTSPSAYNSSSDVGYFLGGDVRFGHLFYIAPGVNYQYQAVNLAGTTEGLVNGSLGVKSFMIPLEVGVNLNAKVLAVRLGVAGTLAFNTGVNDNDFGVTKSDMNNTRWGYMFVAGVRLLAFQLNLSWQQDFTQAFVSTSTVQGNPSGDGKLGQFRLGFGIGL
jgi:hypothetical protein